VGTSNETDAYRQMNYVHLTVRIQTNLKVVDLDLFKLYGSPIILSKRIALTHESHTKIIFCLTFARKMLSKFTVSFWNFLETYPFLDAQKKRHNNP